MKIEIKPKLDYYGRKHDLKSRMDFYGVPGISIAVIDDFRISETAHFGVKDALTGMRVTANTAFQAASISKPVTAMLVMRLVEKGLIELDANANDYLKGYKIKDLDGNATTVSIRDLLSHTSGLGISSFSGYSKGDETPSIESVLKGVPPSNSSAVIAEFRRGEFHYSGGGYVVLQNIIENASGKRFETVAKRELFDEMGLEFSTFRRDPGCLDYASGHRLRRRLRGKYNAYPEKAAAGLWTTPSELAKICIELSSIRVGRKSRGVLSKRSVDLIFTPIAEAWGGHVGLGFFLSETKRGTFFSHDGWNEGYLSKLVYDLSDGYGLVAMINSDSGMGLIDEVFVSIAKAHCWEDLGDYGFY